MNRSKKTKITLPDYDYLESASSTDCTGLIRVPPQSKEEFDHYGDVYPFLPTVAMKHVDKQKE